METKICYVCKEEKNKQEFYKYKRSADGFAYECKLCQKISWKKRYSKNPIYQEKHNEYRREWRKKNREKEREVAAAWREANREKIKEYNSSPKEKERRRNYQKNKRKNPLVRLKNNVGRQIASALKRTSHTKNGGSSFEALGYTPEQLKEHLERQFDDKMNWDNYGSYWHIDHIIPHSSFNYSSMQDDAFKECWKLDNLQPLEAIENIRKSNKVLSESIEPKKDE